MNSTSEALASEGRGDCEAGARVEKGEVTALSRHLRGPGMYGPELAPEPGADEQAQLLAFLGRQG